jgi:hypothetical protein
MTHRPASLASVRLVPRSLAMLGAAVALVACSDDGASTDSTSASNASSSGVGSSTSSTSTGSGGSGGNGGEAPKPRLDLIDLAGPLDLTPDGGVALIEDIGSPNVDLYFYDTSSSALTKKASAGDPSLDMGTAISGTLRVTAIHGNPSQAGVFSETGGWVDLPTPFPSGCDPNDGGAWDVSADGKVVVGFMWNGCSPQAFRWVDDGGAGSFALLDLLGSPSTNGPQPQVNRATVVSDDGSIAAGFAQVDVIDRFPAIWKSDGTGFTLDDLPLDTPGEVLSISSDGKTVAGISGYDAFRWTEASGSVILPRLASALPTDPVFANAIANEGALVFGGSGDAFNGVPVAFVWTSGAGTRALVDIVTANGLIVPTGFVLSNVLAASADGSILLGSAFDPDTFATKSFVLHLPASAYGN